MDTKYLIELRSKLEELQRDSKKLSKKQQELLGQAQDILADAEQRTNKGSTNWASIASLVIQGARLLMQLMHDGG